MIMVSPAPGKYASVGPCLSVTGLGRGHGVAQTFIHFYANMLKKFLFFTFNYFI